MATRTHTPLRTARSAAAGSWMALLAATTLGDAADTLHAEVRAVGLSEGAAYRLGVPGGGAYRRVVQSYDETDGRVPGRHWRPVGSLQRAVSAAELRQGVHVDLLV